MTPTEDDMDALTDIITRLRAENARLREVGQAVVECHSMLDMLGFRRAIDALRAALKEGGGE
jgi:hypothetical protein